MIVGNATSARVPSVLREQLNEALRAATEANDRCAMAIVRLIHAALKERDQKARAEGQSTGLSDGDLMSMLEAMVAQRCDSIRRYEAGGQLELAGREAREIEIITRFLPPQLDDQACAQAVREVIADVGAEKLKDTGRVMTELKSRYPGQMDFAKARRMICQRLG
jgi:uncharacterized protein YqeY